MEPLTDPASTALDITLLRTFLEVVDSRGFAPAAERLALTPSAVSGHIKRLEQAAFDELALRDKDLLQELLDLFAAEYAAAKQRESALDFEDLQLLTRDLLRTDERVREQEQLRFRALMVDEFQDTNRLQCELIDQLCGGPLSALPPDSSPAFGRRRRRKMGGVWFPGRRVSVASVPSMIACGT